MKDKVFSKKEIGLKLLALSEFGSLNVVTDDSTRDKPIRISITINKASLDVSDLRDIEKILEGYYSIVVDDGNMLIESGKLSTVDWMKEDTVKH